MSAAVISGPKENIPLSGTLGEYITACLRKRNNMEPVLIDAVSGKELTVGGLLQNSIKAVHVLKNLGVKRGDVIAIICQNNIEYHIPLIAALCMGVITNPLNPAYSIGELRHALLLSKPKVVLCSSAALKNIQILKKEFDFIQTVLLMGPENECTADTEVVHLIKLLNNTQSIDVSGFVPESFDPTKQVAVILLSSGTTGLPKAVPLTHVNLRYSMVLVGDSRCFGLKPNDRAVLIMPPYHVMGLVTSIFKICFLKNVVVFQKFQTDVFFETIQKYNVNKLHIVSPLLHFFVNQKDLRTYNLSSIEDIAVGGSPTSNHDIAEVRKRLPGVNFREAYGSTEVSGAVVAVTKFPKRTNCVGSVLPNVTLKVCDPDSRGSLGCMEVGELCFKGPMVMSNYLGIPNSTNIIDEDGFYHTGDLGYYDDHELLYVIDRIKDIIKYNGTQVSPIEIERAILQHPNVEDCAVIGIPDKKTGQVPLAFVVPKKGCMVTEQEIIQFVAERISMHKRLHGGVRFIDQIPKNASGKILRRELYQQLITDSCK